jgi:DNA polymerase-4
MKAQTAQGARHGHLPISKEKAQIMHIDLNSAFATIEQQARPSLRGKPVGVTNRISKNCCVIAASYEAKQLGIKVGMGLMEARLIVPDLVMLESDPPKYHFVYKKLCSIMKSYSPNVVMKSIDEGVIDFHGTLGQVNKKPLKDIGLEIKQRLRSEVGSWMKINVGIAPNRFLAKTASNLHKPDGLNEIDYTNLKDIYASLELTDLSGIGRHYEARLNTVGIFTPMDFLNASSSTLKRLVFRSVVGDDWYQRLRGYEVDDEPTKLGQVGRQFVLDKRTSEDSFILPRFQYLCETTGTKLRYNNVDARGVLVWLVLASGEYWQARKMFKSTFYTDREVYARALYLFNQRPKVAVTTIGITCYKLTPTKRSQSSLFEQVNKEEWLTQAVDEINERFGIFTVHSLNSLEGKTIVRQKIPAFGGSRYFELLLKRV